MRKSVTKEITKTTVVVGKMLFEDGELKAEKLDDQILLGNQTLEKAQKEMNKRFGEKVTVFEVKADTQTYTMDVEDFIKHASVKEDESEQLAQPEQALEV